MIVETVRGVECGQAAMGPKEVADERITPVSYTHLDVYKRQADNRMYPVPKPVYDVLDRLCSSGYEAYLCLLYTSRCV